jgi:hypothetical protein
MVARLLVEHGANRLAHVVVLGFVRFPGLRWFNPISGLGSASLRRPKGGKN